MEAKKLNQQPCQITVILPSEKELRLEVKPIAFQLDQNNEFPEEIIKKMGSELNIMGIPYPKEYGGLGEDVISYAIAVEELSRVDGGVGVILSAHEYYK